jgi:flagellar operon protein (TIGR03826 family)
MNVRNCRHCRKIFNHVVGPPICPACREEKEKKYQEVKKYIHDSKTATINQVSEECEVEISQINQWIREERLQFAEDSPIRVSCDKCGAMIRSGVFCDRCKAEMANTFGSVYKKEAPLPEPPKKKQADKDKMRFL